MESGDVIVLDASEDASDLDSLVTECVRLTGERCARIRLTKERVRSCTGCWSCWWKTPGLCVFRDAMDTILPAIVRSRLLLLATPVFCGLPSATMKRVLDRTIPLVHPYIELHYGESHHRKRYAHYPNIGLLCEIRSDRGDEGGDSNNDELKMISTWLERYARNFHAQVVLSADENADPEEVARVLARA
jgi:multimeric flavodoxin WrbA